MKSLNLKALAIVVCLTGGVSTHAASGCSKISQFDRKTKYTSGYDAKTQQALADLRQSTINDLVSNFEPVVQKLVSYNPKFAEYFNGSLADLHRKQMVESFFSVCAIHVDYENGDAVRVVINDLASQLGVQ